MIGFQVVDEKKQMLDAIAERLVEKEKELAAREAVLTQKAEALKEREAALVERQEKVQLLENDARRIELERRRSERNIGSVN